MKARLAQSPEFAERASKAHRGSMQDGPQGLDASAVPVMGFSKGGLLKVAFYGAQSYSSWKERQDFSASVGLQPNLLPPPNSE